MATHHQRLLPVPKGDEIAMDHISFSQLSMYLRCGEQYHRRYILGEKIPPSGALVRGKCGHKALEANFRQKIESRKDIKKKEILSVFSDEWKRALSEEEVAWTPDELDGNSPKKAAGKMKDSGIALVSIYHKEQSPQVQPIEVEQEFRVDFDDGFPPLVGIIDRVTEDYAVEDDKFVSKSPSAFDMITDVQLTCYQLGYQIREGKPPIRLRKRFAISTSTPKSVCFEIIPRNKEQMDRFLNRLQAAMGGIRKGVFLPAANDSWACSERFCGYWSTCKVRK